VVEGVSAKRTLTWDRLGRKYAFNGARTATGNCRLNGRWEFHTGSLVADVRRMRGRV